MLFSSVLSSSHFPSLSQKPILRFFDTRGKMNTGKKHFGEACLWHTILLARSSVLYLLFREAGKGVVSPFRTAHLYPPKTAAKNCEGMSRVWLLFS